MSQRRAAKLRKRDRKRLLQSKQRREQQRDGTAGRAGPPGDVLESPDIPPNARRFGVLLHQHVPGALGIRNEQVARQLRTMSPPPPQQPVAENIDVLLERLSAEDPQHNRYLYRGQTRHYPALIPSIYRGAMIAGTENDPVIAIDAARFHATITERDLVKIRLLSMLMKIHGAAIGNIIAQQYGLNSEVLDVTSDLGVAAFFATRKYPRYEHFAGDGVAEGVIYRFPIHEQMPDIATLNFWHRMAAKHIDPFGDVWFSVFRRRLDLTDEMLHGLEQVFSGAGGKLQVEIRTRPLVVSNTFYRRQIREAWSKRYADDVGDLADTRLMRQSGGSIRTISRWIATIAAGVGGVMLDNGMPVFEPPFAIGEELIGVENISRCPGLEIFPFKHRRNIEIDRTTDELWPAADTDWVYHHLMHLFAMYHSEYLDQHGIAVNDHERGLIDPGYLRS
jgi:hypothetical protein